MSISHILNSNIIVKMNIIKNNMHVYYTYACTVYSMCHVSPNQLDQANQIQKADKDRQMHELPSEK